MTAIVRLTMADPQFNYRGSRYACSDSMSTWLGSESRAGWRAHGRSVPSYPLQQPDYQQHANPKNHEDRSATLEQRLLKPVGREEQLKVSPTVTARYSTCRERPSMCHRPGATHARESARTRATSGHSARPPYPPCSHRPLRRRSLGHGGGSDLNWRKQWFPRGSTCRQGKTRNNLRCSERIVRSGRPSSSVCLLCRHRSRRPAIRGPEGMTGRRYPANLRALPESNGRTHNDSWPPSSRAAYTSRLPSGETATKDDVMDALAAIPPTELGARRVPVTARTTLLQSQPRAAASTARP